MYFKQIKFQVNQLYFSWSGLVASRTNSTLSFIDCLIYSIVVDPKPEQKPQTSVDDSAVVMRRTSSRSKNIRPKSLCDKDLKFMRSASDLGFSHKTKDAVLERRASCTELNNQSKLVANDTQRSGKDNSDSDLSPSESSPEKTKFWDKVGARKLLSRNKNAKARPGGLSDLQTVSSDKILELYARESRGSTSRINSLIMEEDETNPSMGLRTMSSLELKSHAYTRESGIHSSFREARPNFQPLSDFRMSERYTAPSSKSSEQNTDLPAEERKKKPVAKPRLKLRSSSSESNISKRTVASFTTSEIKRSVREDLSGQSNESRKDFISTTLDSYGYTLDKKYDVTEDQGTVECTDVSRNEKLCFYPSVFENDFIFLLSQV